MERAQEWDYSAPRSSCAGVEGVSPRVYALRNDPMLTASVFGPVFFSLGTPRTRTLCDDASACPVSWKNAMSSD
jgi:hypothetical protein